MNALQGFPPVYDALPTVSIAAATATWCFKCDVIHFPPMNKFSQLFDIKSACNQTLSVMTDAVFSSQRAPVMGYTGPLKLYFPTFTSSLSLSHFLSKTILPQAVLSSPPITLRFKFHPASGSRALESPVEGRVERLFSCEWIVALPKASMLWFGLKSITCIVRSSRKLMSGVFIVLRYTATPEKRLIAYQCEQSPLIILWLFSSAIPPQSVFESDGRTNKL